MHFAWLQSVRWRAVATVFIPSCKFSVKLGLRKFQQLMVKLLQTD